MIAISGASGPLARRVAELLLDGVLMSDLVLLTRTPDALRDLARRGAEVRKASFKNPTGLKADLRGVERLLLVSLPPGPNRLELHRQAIAAARTAGVAHVLYTSIAQPSADNPSFLVPDHAATEQALREGFDWTFLRANARAEVALTLAEVAVRSGRLPANTADAAIAWVTRDDVARSAAAVLSTDGHEKSAYDLTGPNALTAAGFAALVGEVTGAPVEVEPLGDDELFDRLIDDGVEQDRADLLSAYGEAARGGFLAKATTDVADLTGRPATPLADVLRAALQP